MENTISQEDLEEIKSVFDSLDIKLPNVEFYNRCRVANYRVSVALDAVKEMAISKQITGVTLVNEWDTIMGTIAKSPELTEAAIDEQLYPHVALNVLEDASSLNLIKVKLGQGNQ